MASRANKQSRVYTRDPAQMARRHGESGASMAARQHRELLKEAKSKGLDEQGNPILGSGGAGQAQKAIMGREEKLRKALKKSGG